KIADAQGLQSPFVGRVRFHRMGHQRSEGLHPFGIAIDGQNLIPHLDQSPGQTAPETPQADHGKLSPAPPFLPSPSATLYHSPTEAQTDKEFGRGQNKKTKRRDA